MIEKPPFTQPFPAAQQLIFCLIPTMGQLPITLRGWLPIILTGRHALPESSAAPSHRWRLSLGVSTVSPGGSL